MSEYGSSETIFLLVEHRLVGCSFVVEQKHRFGANGRKARMNGHAMRKYCNAFLSRRNGGTDGRTDGRKDARTDRRTHPFFRDVSAHKEIETHQKINPLPPSKKKERRRKTYREK